MNFKVITRRSRFLLYLDCIIFVLVLLSQYYKPLYIIGVLYCGVGFLFLRETWIVNFNLHSRLLKFLGLVTVVIYYYFIKWVVEGGEAFYFAENLQKYFGWVVFYIYIYTRSVASHCEITMHYYFNVVLKLFVVVIFTTSFVEFIYPNAGVYVEMRDGFDADRVYGIASRPASTATLLVSSLVALFMINRGGDGAVRRLGKPFLILSGVAFAMMASGTGVLALIIASVFISYQLKGKSPIYFQVIKQLTLVFCLTCFVYGLTLISEIGSHIELDYLELLYKFKYEAIIDNIKLDEILIGRVNHEYFQYGSDFGAAALVAHIGILGLMLFVLLISININYYNIVALAVMLISYFHYPAISVSSGSLVFALILTLVRLDEPAKGMGFRRQSRKSRLLAMGND